jgi:hypothetical protein
MSTLVLAERPFRDLRSRALLAALRQRIADPAPLLVATAAPRCPPGFAPVPPEADPAALGLRRVLLAGVFQDRAALEAALRLAGRALAAGAVLEARNLALEHEAAKRHVPEGLAVLDRAAVLEARDTHTANTLLVWRVAPPVRLALYPERAIAPDPSLAAALPPGPILGLAILGGEAVARAVAERRGGLRARLAPWAGWPVLPLPAEATGGKTDDLPGTRAFAGAVLPGATLLLPELDDPVWRRRRLDPARHAGLAARCRAVVTNQDLAAVAAIAAGVPVLGLALGWDRRIVAVMSGLANALPPGSDLLHLPPDPA